MAKIELDKILAPTPDAPPCGPDLWPTGLGDELERNARAKPDQVNWPAHRDRCADLLATRCKDLRTALHLALAMLATDGVAGFSDGLLAIRKLLDQYWDNLYPRHIVGQMPAKRVAIMEWMVPRGTDELRFRTRLKEAPLTGQNGQGQLSLRDIEYASGKVAPPPGVTAPTMENVEAAFAACDVEQLKATAGAAQAAGEQLKEIAAYLARDDRAGSAPAFAELQDILSAIEKEVTARIKAAEPAPAADQAGGEGAAVGAGGARPAADGAIRSDRDVIAAIDRICDYYRRTQPSNPIPLLLECAERWVGTGFLDLVSDLNLDTKDKLDVVLGLNLKDKK